MPRKSLGLSAPTITKINRIRKPNAEFSVIYPHSAKRALAEDGSWYYATADDEDAKWILWGTVFNLSTGWNVVGSIIRFAQFIRGRQYPTRVPIPGSKRWYAMGYK